MVSAQNVVAPSVRPGINDPNTTRRLRITIHHSSLGREAADINGIGHPVVSFASNWMDGSLRVRKISVGAATFYQAQRPLRAVRHPIDPHGVQSPARNRSDDAREALPRRERFAYFGRAEGHALLEVRREEMRRSCNAAKATSALFIVAAMNKRLAMGSPGRQFTDRPVIALGACLYLSTRAAIQTLSLRADRIRSLPSGW